MREQYIANKVNSLFHAKHQNSVTEERGEIKISSIMSFINEEIQKSNKELNNRLMRKLYLCLKEKL